MVTVREPAEPLCVLWEYLEKESRTSTSSPEEAPNHRQRGRWNGSLKPTAILLLVARETDIDSVDRIESIARAGSEEDMKHFGSYFQGLRGILLVAVAIRLALAPFSAHPFDMYFWFVMVDSIVKNGPLAVTYYPPLLHYTFVPIAFTYDWLLLHFPIQSIRAWNTLPVGLNPYPNETWILGVTEPAFNALIKIPFIIGDLIAGVSIYKIAQLLDSDTKHARKAALAWLLNPFVIWISSVWGMYDSLAVAFALLSLWAMFVKKPRLSAFLMAIGALFKLFPVLIFAAAIIWMSRQRHGLCWIAKNCAVFASTFIAVTLVSNLYFVGEKIGTSPSFMHFLGYLLSRKPPIGPNAYGLTFFSISLLTNVQTPQLQLVSTAIFFAACSLLMTRFWQSRQKDRTSLLALQALSVVVILLSSRIVSEQYLTWVLPYFAIQYGISGRKTIVYLSTLGILYTLMNLQLPLFFLPALDFLPRSLYPLFVTWRTVAAAGGAATGQIRLGWILAAIIGTLVSSFLAIPLISYVKNPQHLDTFGDIRMASHRPQCHALKFDTSKESRASHIDDPGSHPNPSMELSTCSS